MARRLGETVLEGLEHVALEEMRAIWTFAEAESYPYGPLLQVLLLTALRRGEVAAPRVSEVDFAARLLRLPAARMKAGVAFEAALQARHGGVAAGAGGAPREVALRVSKVPDAAFSGWSKAKRRADAAVGFSAWTLHDFRRGIVTAMAERGLADIGTLDTMLAHSATASLGSGAAAIYQKSAMLDGRRKAAEMWAKLLLGAEVATATTDAAA
jgi:integrase